MKLLERIDALVQLGASLHDLGEASLEEAIQRTFSNNPWLTPENCRQSLEAIRDTFLRKTSLQEWVAQYSIEDEPPARKIGLVMAGNIPLVGFHDVLSVFVSGHTAQIKLSDKDPFLLPFLLEKLNTIDPRTRVFFQITDRLTDFDGVIATGSNNSSRYFESYFGRYPNIIRKNRNAVAILNGKEKDEELKALCRDIFDYFGLGCRSVAKLYVPEDYDFSRLLAISEEFEELSMHNKFRNNFEYNLTLLLLNRIPHQASKSLLIREDPSLLSRIGMVHYSRYSAKEELLRELRSREEEIQCIVSAESLDDLPTVVPGNAQKPSLSDYADGVDTLQFLTGLYANN
jgi:hypothetical protein